MTAKMYLKHKRHKKGLKNFELDSEANYPENQVFIGSVDVEVMKKMPTSTETFMEKRSIFKGFKNAIKIISIFIRF